MSLVSTLCILLVLASDPNLTARFIWEKDDRYSEIPMVVNFEIMYLWIAMTRVASDNRFFMFWVWYSWHYTFRMGSPLYLFALL